MTRTLAKRGRYVKCIIPFNNETEARAFWSSANVNWNCYLFAAAPLASQPGCGDLEFGSGKWCIDVGTIGERNAVFITPAKNPGVVGESAARENIPRDGRTKGDIALYFPTEEQCNLVADALCNQPKAMSAVASAAMKALGVTI